MQSLRLVARTGQTILVHFECARAKQPQVFLIFQVLALTQLSYHQRVYNFLEDTGIELIIALAVLKQPFNLIEVCFCGLCGDLEI